MPLVKWKSSSFIFPIEAFTLELHHRDMNFLCATRCRIRCCVYVSITHLSNKITIYLEIQISKLIIVRYIKFVIVRILCISTDGGQPHVTRLHLDWMYYCLDWFGTQCGASRISLIAKANWEVTSSMKYYAL